MSFTVSPSATRATPPPLLSKAAKAYAPYPLKQGEVPASQRGSTEFTEPNRGCTHLLALSAKIRDVLRPGTPCGGEPEVRPVQFWLCYPGQLPLQPNMPLCGQEQ